MSIFNRAYLYIIRKKVRSSILFLIVTLISFFLLSGSVLNTTVNNISKNLYKDVNFGFNIESVDKSNKEIEKDTLKKIEELKMEDFEERIAKCFYLSNIQFNDISPSSSVFDLIDNVDREVEYLSKYITENIIEKLFNN